MRKMFITALALLVVSGAIFLFLYYTTDHRSHLDSFDDLEKVTDIEMTIEQVFCAQTDVIYQISFKNNTDQYVSFGNSYNPHSREQTSPISKILNFINPPKRYLLLFAFYDGDLFYPINSKVNTTSWAIPPKSTLTTYLKGYPVIFQTPPTHLFYFFQNLQYGSDMKKTEARYITSNPISTDFLEHPQEAKIKRFN